MKNEALANECLDAIWQIAVSRQTARRKYKLLHQVFVGVLMEHTQHSTLSFSGPYARFDYLCRQVGYPEAATRRVNAFRNRVMKAEQAGDDTLLKKWPCDLKAVTEFAACLYQVAVPEKLKSLLPANYPREEYQGLTTDCVRVVVRTFDANEPTFSAQPIDSDARLISVCYRQEKEPARDFGYLAQLVQVGDRLNLIRPKLHDGVYYPELIVLLPDLLINITTISSCFKEVGNSALNYLISLVNPNPTTAPMLLGNFAGQMLDEEVHHIIDDVSYAKSARSFFGKNAAKLAVIDIDQAFGNEAQRQQLIIRDMVRNKFREIPYYKPSEVLLEPSFFSEMLGLQGRMDLLQADMRVLIEQKSGKRNYFTNGHQETHYVQMLLYRAILQYNYQMPAKQIDTYLLYSKFKDGLLKEGSAPALLAEAMMIRNQIARMTADLAQGRGEEMMMAIEPEHLNLKHIYNNFWNNFILPQLTAALKPMHQADVVTRKYFFRMLTFVTQEYMLDKTGTANKEASGVAAMWNATTEEKLSAGNMLVDLVIKQLEEKAAGEGITTMVMGVDADGLTTLPNFRVGDMVVAYAYETDGEPRPTNTILFRANITAMEPDAVTIALLDPQKNKRIFRTGDAKVRWALEHDSSDNSFTRLTQSVAQVLRATPQRRKLLLGLRPPRTDSSRVPVGTYGTFDGLVRKFVGALDYMLLIGPPGTGKTSFGLVNILKEQLATDHLPVLLLSFTNRAVNEICSKLVEHGIDFVRLGHSTSCPDDYRKYLMGERAAACQNLTQVREMIATTRVFVSTTSTMLNNVQLLESMQFGLAIVDEASQILDPHLLGILCARHGQRDAIKRFVLIGDQKQLPAVVQQSEEVSEVKEEELRELGITNCRHSLFERLLRLNSGMLNDASDSALNNASADALNDASESDDGSASSSGDGLSVAVSSGDGSSPGESAQPDVVYMFSKQGRMHRDVADFANVAFYGGKLDVVPLDHQLAPMALEYDPTNALAQQLATQRMLFFAVDPRREAQTMTDDDFRVGEDKVNRPEARCIARIVKTVYDLWLRNGRTFEPDKSLGIIVPYRHQIACVKDCLKAYGIAALLEVTIDTVERFQGSQRDVIVYGFTIQKRRQLDFLLGNIYDDNGTPVDRKLNVALTRAREQNILVGNPRLLANDSIFARLLNFVKEKGGYIMIED